MNNIKNAFTIKDLENLTGIKAHTIRIWEKRYNILQPLRTDTNIRIYDTKSLQKLLNINTLNAFGYKISVISKLPDERIPEMVKEIINNKTVNDHVLRNFKLAMMNFDTRLFIETYNSLLAEKPFREIYYHCFIPLLEEIGSLWQTDTITPAHEHFISNLIKQKVMVNIEALLAKPPKHTSRTYVLFLPDGEIHKIGLMLINYELLAHGYHTIYLGESVPMENIAQVKEMFDNVTFISYFTIEPAPVDINNYILDFKEQILKNDGTELMVFGQKTEHINSSALGKNIKVYKEIGEFVLAL